MRIPSVPIPKRLFEELKEKTPGQGAEYVNARFAEVVQGFPDFDKLDPFTNAMVSTSIDRDKVKQALGRLHGVQPTIRRLAHVTNKEFLGRMQSILKKLTPTLKLLGEARGFLRRLPNHTAHYTICLAGFPNAGKTTLLASLTGSGAKIANYSFTTKALNYGTMDVRHIPVQVVDTPGTLDRADKMNSIEQQAIIAQKHLANALVFVFDPLRDDESQEHLYEKTRKLAKKKPFAVYASKQDIVEHVPAFAELGGDVPLFTDPKALGGWIEPFVVARGKAEAPIQTDL
jgi:nucleolar GTP-binding protein